MKSLSPLGHQLKRITAALLCCWLGLSAPIDAAPLFYRYQDDNGRTVLSSSLPPEAARKGYQIVDQYGRVLQQVAPELTPEQIAERDRKLAEEARAAEEARLQAEKDRALLERFPSVGDAIRARDRRLAELDGLIAFKSTSISKLEEKISEQEGRAANLEKTGRAVPEILKTQIERDRSQLGQLQSEVRVHEQEKQDVNDEYEVYIKRLKQLT